MVLGQPVVASAQASKPLRVAGNTGDAYAESVYAHDRGFFEKAGLNVDLSILAGGSIIAASVASGDLDIGVSNIIPIALAYLRGIPFSFFCSGGMYDPDAAALCVANDGPIKTAKDLEGQTVASSSLTDLNTLAIRTWVDQNGGDSTKIRFVEVPSPEMQSALLRGTVSAAPIFEPFLTVARNAGGIRLLAPHMYGVFGRSFMICGYFARSDWLVANAAVARRFASVIYSTGNWAGTHHADTAAILARVGKLDPNLASGMSRAPYGKVLVPAMLQSTLDLAYKYKILSRRLGANEIITQI